MNVDALDWYVLKGGVEWKKYRFENDMLINRYSEGEVVRKPGLLSGFVENKLKLGLLSIRPGLRISRFYPQTDPKTEVRLNGAYFLSEKIKLKAAWGQYLQPVISLNTQEYELRLYLHNYYPLLRLDLSLKKKIRKGFGAYLATYLGAENAYLNVTFGNLLFFLHRNVWFYINREGTLYGVGSNYFPEFNIGYSVQF